MKTSTFAALIFIFLAAYSCSWTSYADEQEDFLECLEKEFKHYASISSVVYTPRNAYYASILKFSIRNPRFDSNSTLKPLAILTPEQESQIPPIIYCAKESDLQIRIRSGGHDAEGLSYVSQVPFVILDLINFTKITIDVEGKTAWVGAGATLGSLYYRIAEESSTLGFPAGLCPSVGAGGHISGGGYGVLLRKYGLAADNVIDARIVDVNGKIMDRKAMDEDLFWALKGGMGASFGVITEWKLQLVDVPETVTTCTTHRTLEQNATQLVHNWQYVAPKVDRDLYIYVQVGTVNSSQDGKNMTISASFNSFFLGNVDQLQTLMHKSFPELGLSTEDCTERSWIQAALFAGSLGGYPSNPIESLLNRTQPNLMSFKVKSDYVQKPIPKDGLEGMWRTLYEPGGERGEILFTPYGGRMDDISASSTPFPHRAGNLFLLSSTILWGKEEAHNSDKYIGWSRRFYHYLTPYVSKFPRGAYANYRDLDLGVNNIKGEISYARASIWGLKYFKNNFNRLVRVKTIVDPENFFRDEQSIPSLTLEVDRETRLT